MTHPLEQLRADALRDIASAEDERLLEAVRIRFRGRSGAVSQWSEETNALAKEEKPIVGKLLNEVRAAVTPAIQAPADEFRAARDSAAVANLDMPLTGR